MVSEFDSSHFLLIFNQAFLGVSASLLLKHLNSIVKAFSTAIEMMASALLSYRELRRMIETEFMSLNALISVRNINFWYKTSIFGKKKFFDFVSILKPKPSFYPPLTRCSHLIFGITIGSTSEWASYFIVIFSIYLYTLNPIDCS